MQTTTRINYFDPNSFFIDATSKKVTKILGLVLLVVADQ